MKRAYEVALWIAVLVSAANAQWTGGPTGPVYYNGGNVGIGTPNPQAKLEILNPGGYGFRVGQGGGSPLLDVWQTASTSSPGPRTSLLFYGGAFELFDQSASVSRLWIAPASGNVGIGTTNPQYKLAIEGAIGARDIIVTNAPWSDYVFRPDYRLRPLSEVASFIRQHGRLPGIPPEAEVKEKGISVAEMQAKLLAKVEELTLHAIRQERELDRIRGLLADASELEALRGPLVPGTPLRARTDSGRPHNNSSLDQNK